MRPAEFALTTRRVARSGRTTLVVHCRMVEGRDEPHVGFVVPKAVGGAVTRNKVRRRLRGLVVELRDVLPPGADVVVRALPPAALATYETLGLDYRGALGRATGRAGVMSGS